MSENNRNGSEITSSTSPAREENSREMSVLLQKVLGTETTPNFTEKQVDELLSQKREITNYIHKDKIRDSYDSRFYLVAILLFVLIFSGGVVWFLPNYFGEVLSFLTGIFGGALGGYGIGIRKK